MANTETNSSSEETKLISDSQDIKKSEDSENMQKSDRKTTDLPTTQQIIDSWSEDLLPKLSKKARARFSAAKPLVSDENGVTISLPNEPHLRRCQELVGEVETAIKNTFGVSLPVLLSVDDVSLSSISPPNPSKPPAPAKIDESFNPDELVEADANAGSAVERIAQAFPGAEIVESE